MAYTKALVVVALSMMVAGACSVVVPSEAAYSAISCNDVTDALKPCLSYVTSNNTPMPGQCCDGVKQLSNEAKSKADITMACQCIKSLLSVVPGLIPSRASAIPNVCGVNTPFPISRDANCS